MPVDDPMPDCGAKTRTGEPCTMQAMSNGRCRMHGGLTPTGLAHPSTVHGRYSRHLPTRLAGRYLEAQSDPDLVSVREEMALVDARIADVLTRVDTGEAGALWAALGKAVGEYRAAADEDRDAAFSEIEHLCRQGLDDWAAWAEVLNLIERRRKLAETETKRLAAIGQTITAERAMLLLSAVVDVIKRHVTDHATLAALSRDIGALVDRGTQPAA